MLRGEAIRANCAPLCGARPSAAAAKEEYYYRRLDGADHVQLRVYKRFALQMGTSDTATLSDADVRRVTRAAGMDDAAHAACLAEALHVGVLAGTDRPGTLRVPIPSLTEYLRSLDGVDATPPSSEPGRPP